MNEKPPFSLPLEALLAKIKKKEENLWGKIQSSSHKWLSRLEAHPFLQNYCTFLNKTRSATSLRSGPTIELDSLFLLSVLFHLLLIFLLARLSFTPTPPVNPEPILVRFFDLGKTSQKGIKKGKIKPKKIARPHPKPPTPVAAKPKPAKPLPKAKPLLPGPKVLAEAPKEITGFTGEPVEAMIQMPTSETGGSPSSVQVEVDPLPRALTIESSMLPKSLSRIESIRGEDIKVASRVSSLSGPDFNAYLNKIKNRVNAVWKYPQGISGKHKVYLSFVLDRAGTLVQVKVLDSPDSKVDSSALQAMKLASPFPPIPESLKDLAGEQIGITFTIDLGLKTTP